MSFAGLAGRMRLHPGAALPTIASSRPMQAAQLARGRPAADLPGTLGALFTLCAHAHRGTARRAVAAARGERAVSSIEERTALQAATAREQILRIAHDWHRLLPAAPAAEPVLLLRSCPLWRDALDPAEQLQALPVWLAHHWLSMPLAEWLRAHEADPSGWALQWCAAAATPPARLLRTQSSGMQALATPGRPLRLLDQPLASMPRLAERLRTEPDFCAHPDWQGEPAETGPWTRTVDPVPLPLHNAWMRLIARFVDVLRLAAPQGRDWLAEGALPLAHGEAIAWTEMARGLLVHWVRLEDSPSGPRVADCRVLAPTEWNFHPRGVLAQTLATLHGPDRAGEAARAAVAFDPCVEFDIDSGIDCTPAMEPAHA
ncbi:MAG TPA: hydrogenase maturation factor HoxV/HupK [Piscinibacter sp.]|nr:hydrogenase maturation factor HoxV/HupK [Piscinibacter sp.]